MQQLRYNAVMSVGRQLVLILGTDATWVISFDDPHQQNTKTKTKQTQHLRKIIHDDIPIPAVIVHSQSSVSWNDK